MGNDAPDKPDAPDEPDAPDAPDWAKNADKVIRNWKGLDELSEGRLSMKVKDSDGNLKKQLRNARISGEGSIQAFREAKTQNQEISAETQDFSDWSFKRKDK